MTAYQQYLTTLRRVPDDIVLAVATRSIEPIEPESCLCGWFIRERIARMAGKDADGVDPYVDGDNLTGVVAGCVKQFGGSEEEWDSIFGGIVVTGTAEIERAFVERVLECVS